MTYNLERREYLTSTQHLNSGASQDCCDLYSEAASSSAMGLHRTPRRNTYKNSKIFYNIRNTYRIFLIFLLGKYEIHIKLKKTCQQIELRLDLFVWAFRSPVASRSFGPRSNESCNDKRGIHKGLTATCQFSTSWTQLELEVHSRYAYQLAI